MTGSSITATLATAADVLLRCSNRNLTVQKISCATPITCSSVKFALNKHFEFPSIIFNSIFAKLKSLGLPFRPGTFIFISKSSSQADPKTLKHQRLNSRRQWSHNICKQTVLHNAHVLAHVKHQFRIPNHPLTWKLDQPYKQ
ncbi:hypothetical protein TcWFU_005310 [Taenia crassiceps]|uniref:Uncharacterized protein n=1 Tax=Taenia crassiceps TaxID=6207 RepID=A0ABR4Q6B9_9CEST